MQWTEWLSRWLPIAALGVTLLGLVDPLEGFPVVLMGGVLTLMAAIQTRSHHTRLVRSGVALAAVGAAAMVAISMTGGAGGNSGRSVWWLASLAPYPIGVVLCVVGGVLILRERSLEGRVDRR
jgi:hypothetical protein